MIDILLAKYKDNFENAIHHNKKIEILIDDEFTINKEVNLIINAFYMKEIDDSQLYDILLAMIEFNESEKEVVEEISNYLIYSISKELIPGIIGSRLLSSLWHMIDYPDYLFKIISFDSDYNEHKENDKLIEINNKIIKEAEIILNKYILG